MKAPKPGLTIDAEVIRVIDGDTVEVETRLRHRVRLMDCWAPETRTRDELEKERGYSAKRRMQSLVDQCNGQVRLFVPGADGDLSKLSTISRVLGRLWRRLGVRHDNVEGRDLSAILVSEGHATKEKPCD